MMKRLPHCIYAMLLLCCLLGNQCVHSMDFYVGVNGSDKNEGTQLKPLATLQAAILKARNWRRLQVAPIKESVRIIIADGTYQTLETIVLRPEDGGSEVYPTIIEAALGASPILSGGIPISHWNRLTTPVAGMIKKYQQHIWVADVPMVNGQSIDFRQLWVNNHKATRAKSANADTMHRILHWNKSTASCVIPSYVVKQLTSLKGAEMFIHQWWETANLRIKTMKTVGDSTHLFFEEPESTIQNEHPWPAPWLSKATGNSAFYLTNALAFLDEPGEWYFDKAQHKIYYWPTKNENLATAKAVVPYTTTLLTLQGYAEKPIAHLHIKGIAFEHTNWLRPSTHGHVPHQAGLYMTEAYKLRPAGTAEKPALDNQAWVGRPAAALSISFAQHISIQDCKFLQLAAVGIDAVKGVSNLSITGNVLQEIGSNAIMAGNFGDEGREIHLPYQPVNSTEACSRLLIHNNLINNIGNEDWGAVGIAAGFLSELTVTHNEIYDVPYSGISLGWGWTTANSVLKNNSIRYNNIHHFGRHNYDCAGIYTQSNQPQSDVSFNVVDSAYKAPYAHLPSHWFYLYADEGTSGVRFQQNWTPSKKYLQNATGPGNIWDDNGPEVHNSIKQRAGLQKEYQPILIFKQPAISHTFNEEHAAVIELIIKEGTTINLPKLKNLLAQNNMDSSALYFWQQRIVYFGNVVDLGVMEVRLQNNFPEATVKVYHDRFYNYSKQQYCANPTTTKEWEHIVLSANLVKDTKLQQAYLDDHATQFTKWPEVIKGFCNADFQQLQIFKQGRQLVLVISIPKGESLDKLNPRTTANNPRVEEWNKRMQQFQEGIEGTKKGETWVFFNKQ